jgi:GGDEF domain-containing protein
MENSFIDRYELIDGYTIVDSYFTIITANEEMYRFMGISTSEFSIMDLIHQVDLDDFIDAANCLRNGQSNSLVLRMRRCDNSYRWMLIDMLRCTPDSQNNVSDHPSEFLELHISDILALKKQFNSLQNTLLDLRHLLAMENQLFFTYDYSSNIIQVNNFIDNEISNILELPLNLFKQDLIDNHFISNDSKNEFEQFITDIQLGKVSYNHIIKTNFITKSPEYDACEFKGTTVYTKMKPFKAVGSIKNIDANTLRNYTIKTFEYKNNELSNSYNELKEFCRNNIKYNPNCELAMILLEIDHIDELISQEGSEFTDKLYNNVIQSIKKMVGYRGIVCEIRNNLIAMVVRDINKELYLRSFVESLRSQIAWDYKQINPKYKITFSIGIARYPFNGTDLEKLNRKLVKALEIAEEKGGNRYIIYKEYLHGEMD